MKTMQDVLRAHWSASTHTDQEPTVDKCDGCGTVLREWGDDSDMPAQLAAHQAAALSAAGFGPVHEARAEAWDECEAAKYEIRLDPTSRFWEPYKINPYRKASDDGS